MSSSPQKRDATTPPHPTVSVLFGDIADTSWRMFVPTIGMTILGLLVDKWLHTTPWIMILGIILGTGVAGLLIRAQLKKVNKT